MTVCRRHSRTLALAAITLTISSRAWENEVPPDEFIVSPVQYGHGRRLGASADTCEASLDGQPWEPLRLGVHYIDLETDLPDQTMRDFVRTDAVPRAVSYWQKTLKVRRAQAPIRAGRSCRSQWLPGKCARVRYDGGGASCGSIDGTPIMIPDEYLDELITYGGCYTDGTCIYPTVYPAGTGYSDVDMVILVTAKPDSDCGSNGVGTFAFALSCQRDQCDRPTFGLINFAKDELVGTMIHELTHALVFSTSKYPLFRYADGSPRVPRDPADSQLRPYSTRYQCSTSGGLSVTYPKSSGNYMYTDAPGVVEVSSARGMNKEDCKCPTGRMSSTSSDDMQKCLLKPKGSCVYKIVTPKVVEKARDYFGCSTLDGMELENHGSGQGCTVLESHWEQRILEGELMVPVTGFSYNFMSEITLALFEDSGWYLPDYSMATKMYKGMFFGYKQGCSFAEDKCINDAGAVTFENGQEKTSHFCSAEDDDEHRCSLDLKTKVQCTIKHEKAPCPQYEYAGPVKHGKSFYGDYCPIWEGASAWDCELGRFDDMSRLNGELFATDSICLMSSLRRSQYLGGGKVKIIPNPKQISACHRVECSADRKSYAVFVAVGYDGNSNDVRPVGTCYTAGQTLKDPNGEYSKEVSAYSYEEGYLTCADPALVCAVKNYPHLSLQSNNEISDGSGPGPNLGAEGFAPGVRPGLYASTLIIVVFSIAFM
ncbi:hypothetical protein FOZ60_012524 [Perkinsus olseni]|uniref:Leishmanolysin-like peptidase n=2 Tax=Perkinsus olseni TaxID=32597 RepID=A0A7J6PB62_PEROL|nr:hypothetical protein FOZ60_012524 [Perkinsus olseni]